MSSRTGIVLLVFILLFSQSAQSAETDQPRGTALVIGNAKYVDAHSPLKGPINNAGDIASGLKAVGFDVTVAENLSTHAMQASLNRFYEGVKPGTISIIFFSG